MQEGNVEWTVHLQDVRIRVAGPPAVVAALGQVGLVAPAWTARAPVRVAIQFAVVELPGPRRYRVTRDGNAAWETDRSEAVVSFLEWAIADAAARSLASPVLVHAAATARGDWGVVLPGASGSGKSTLAAALVLAGFRYFSDEVTALDPATGRILPFAKSLYVRPGAREALVALHPALHPDRLIFRSAGEPLWYLPPRPEWLPARPAVPGVVVLPRFVPDHPTILAPVPRGLALQRLLEESFNVQEQGALGVETLVGMLRAVDCYTLTFASLDQAVEAIRALAPGEKA